MKKIISLLLAVVLLTVARPIAFASKSEILTLLKQEVKKSGYNIKVRKAEEAEIKKYSRRINRSLEELGFMDKIRKQGFKEIHDENIETFIFRNRDTRDRVVLTQKLYVNESGEKVIAQIMYRPETRTLLQLHSSKVIGTEAEPFFTPKDVGEDGNEGGCPGTCPASGNRTKAWPTFPQWLCWMGSELACITYCAPWGLLTVIGGIACGVACNAMFFAVCNGVK